MNTINTLPATDIAEEQVALKATPNTKAYVALFVGAACIGFSAIFTKLAGVPGPVAGFYRAAIATAFLAIPYIIIVRREGMVRPNVSGKDVRRIAFLLAALAGLFFALDLSAWNTSLLMTSAANSTLLGNTSTLWVSLGAAFIFHESLKRRFWLGMVVAILGAVIVVGPELQHPTLGLGDLLALVSSLFYTGYLLTTPRARRYLGTLQFMWLSSAVAALFMFLFVLATSESFTGYSADQYMALVGLGLVSHVTGWMCINYALGHLPAPVASVSLLSQPVFTAIVAVPILGEGLSLYQVGGGLLVLVGIYIVNRR